MKITFLSDSGSWKIPAILEMASRLRKKGHRVKVVHHEGSVPRGDILFILGFFKIVPARILNRNRTNIVIHESALPKGRGMSPVTWQVIEGAKSIPMTLFEAVERVDAGNIYLRGRVPLKGGELLPEIHVKVVREMVRLCLAFIARYPDILKRGRNQKGPSTTYRWRTPEDSRLDPQKSIASQFNLLRTIDNDAYPAYFTLHGATYHLKIEKK